MLHKHKFLSIFVAAAILLTFGAGVTASGFVNIVNPEQANVPVMVPPLLAPPGASNYINQQTNAAVFAPDGRPVAQLNATPVELAQAIAVDFPEDRPERNTTTISYAILASLRYTGGGHTVLVTTARPSPAAAKRPTALGNETIQLNDGSAAWATTGIPGDMPNQVVFVQGDLIITVAGDLPIGTLKDLAAKVVIKSNK